MAELTAIDILIEPDGTALHRADAENARLRAQYAEGFALDAFHKPHINLLQRYVCIAQLDGVFAAVEGVIGSVAIESLPSRATGIRHMPVAAIPGHGLAAIAVTPGPEIVDLQSKLIEAVSPFVGTGGDARAFATTPEEPAINADTLEYVERYVPDHSANHFVAHLTVGLAPLAFLDRVEQEAFETFGSHPAGLSVYQLGNDGTARKQLKSSRV